MGFQLVEATMADNTVKKGVVYNADLLLFESEPRTKLLGETYSRLAAIAESSEPQVKAIRVIPRSNAIRTGAFVKESFGHRAPGSPAKDAPKEPTQPGAVFKRFSALGGTSIQRGTVQPDFGQPGGGVEVIFTDGTHRATVSGPTKIPD